jgi:hypothetical protein
MSGKTIQPSGERLRSAVRWISEVCQGQPEKSRKEIIFEAEERFDLSPKECEFLNEKFISKNDN